MSRFTPSNKNRLDNIEREVLTQAIGYDISNYTILTNVSLFGTSHGWVKIGETGTVSEDSVNFIYSDKGLNVAVTDGASVSIEKNISTTDFTSKLIIVNIFVTDAANVERLWFYLALADTLTKSWISYYPTGRLKEGWNRITIPVGSLQTSNGATQTTLQNIGCLYFLVKAKTGTACSVTYDSFDIVANQLTRGKVILAFDDGAESVYTLAKPIMDAAGYPGVAYVVKDLVGVADCMTLAQIQDLYNKGWDIGTHGQIVLTTLTQTQLRAEFLKNYTYLVENGMGRTAIHYASHQGQYNELAIKEMKKIFATHRTTNFEFLGMPTMDRYRLPNCGGNNCTAAAMKGYIDTIVSYKACVIINFHKFVSVYNGVDTYVPDFQELLDYIATQPVDVVTLSDLFYAPVNQNLATIESKQVKQGSTTARRPAIPDLYEFYFDTTLNIPIWWNGSNWVDSAGATV